MGLHTTSTLLLLTLSIGLVLAKQKGVHYKVSCGVDTMQVDIMKRDEVSAIYLQHLKDFPEKSCQPQVEGHKATFILKLGDIYQCMLTKVVNKLTNRVVFYHRVVVEYSDETPKEWILVKCDSGLTPLRNSTYESEIEEISLVKRQADFPLGFHEDYEVEITSEVTGHAPTPVLNVGVRQDGTLIDDQLNVKPGTPLNMEIFLDSESAAIYGLLVTGMEVTDTKAQIEPILVNGCSVDPYLFENFLTTDGDYLRAKFRAFKFPESNFVLFKGTVNVCLDACKGVQCSNGQLGFGRRRREISRPATDTNKVYEISMSTIIRLECDDCDKKGKELVEEEGSVQVVSKKDFYEGAPLSALFEEFEAPGITVFARSTSGGAAHSRATSGLMAAAVLVILLLVLNQ